MREMQINGIKSYETDNFKITYVAAGTTTTFDNEAIKEEG